MPYGHMDDGWDGGWWVMVVLMVLIVAAVVVAIAAMLRHAPMTAQTPMPPAPMPNTATPTAKEILGERLARGEIDAKEYRDRMQALQP